MARDRDAVKSRAGEGAETRLAILRAARGLFMEHGYRAVSTRQIADACGLTQPALYRHFADKQELYAAVLEDELETMRLGLERIASRGTGIGERLRQVIRFMPTNRQDLAQMFHDIGHELDQETRLRLRGAFERSMVAPIAAIFEDGVRSGVLRDLRHGGAPPVVAAYLLLGMLQRPTGRTDRTHGGLGDDEQRAELIVRMMLHGLLAPNTHEPDEPAAPSAPSGTP